MAEDSTTDLEEFWEELRIPPAIAVVSGKASNVREGLEVAAAKTAMDLSEKFKALINKPLTPEALAQVVAGGVEVFLKNWYDDLRGREPATLVAVVLEGQSLPIEELKGFVRALPLTLLQRIVEQGSMGRTASGVHALLAFEYHYRQHRGRDYELRRDIHNKLIVTGYPNALNGQPLEFNLEEMFDVPPENRPHESDP